MSTSAESDPSMEEEGSDKEVHVPTSIVPAFGFSNHAAAGLRPSSSRTPGPGNARVRVMKEGYETRIAALEQENGSLKIEIAEGQQMIQELYQLWQDSVKECKELAFKDHMKQRVIESLKKGKAAAEGKYVEALQRQQNIRQKGRMVEGKYSGLKRKYEDKNIKVSKELHTLHTKARLAFQSVMTKIGQVMSEVDTDAEISDASEGSE